MHMECFCRSNVLDVNIIDIFKWSNTYTYKTNHFIGRFSIRSEINTPLKLAEGNSWRCKDGGISKFDDLRLITRESTEDREGGLEDHKNVIYRISFR